MHTPSHSLRIRRVPQAPRLHDLGSVGKSVMAGARGAWPALIMLAWWAALAGQASVARAQFTPGRLVVSQLGDGVTTTGTVPIRLREFTTSGSATGMEVPLPFTDAGSNFAIAGNISNTSIGFLLKQSVDKRYLTIIGNGTNATASRTIARIDAAGTVDSSTRFSAAGTNVRSAITTTGTDLWWSGDTGSGVTGGIRYTTLGSTSNGVSLAQGTGGSAPGPGGLYQVPSNSRVIGIFNDELYGSAAVGVGPSGSVSFRGVFNVGTGLPTTANQYGAILAGGGGGNTGTLDSAWEFFFANPSTIYVADDDTTAPTSGGLQKWVLSSGSWSRAWSATPPGATGLRGLTGLVTGTSVQLFGITAVATNAGANSLVALVDTLEGTVAPAFTTLANADANYVFRGVAFAPVPEPATMALGAAGLALLAVRRLWKRPAS
jgi:hypothetical protein